MIYVAEETLLGGREVRIPFSITGEPRHERIIKGMLYVAEETLLGGREERGTGTRRSFGLVFLRNQTG